MAKVKAEIISIKNETHDVKTFRLKTDNKIDFIPGQYCLVSIESNEDLKEEIRPFTFASSPTEKYMELTIKQMGKFTTAMHNLKEKDKLLLDGPRGQSLNFNDSVKEDVVFIAGGSGITPFMSALRYAIAKNLSNRFALLFSNRTKKDIIYEKEFENMNKRENIKIVHTLTDEQPEDWNLELGRINKEMIERHVDNLKEKIWYICGPPKMVKAIRELLISVDVPEDKLRWEDWQISGKHDN